MPSDSSQRGRKNPTPAAPLLQILREKVLPWAAACDDRCYTVCDPDRGLWPQPQHEVGKPAENGAQWEYLTPCPARGKSLRTKTRSSGQDVAVSSRITATWPQDGLQASRAPYIVCFLQGNAQVRIGDFLFHGRAGDFLFLPPEVPLDDGIRPHFVSPSSDSRHCAILWLSLPGCWICHSQDDKHHTEPQESCYVLHSQSLDLFHTLMHEIGAGGERQKTSSPHNAAISRHLFIALLHALCREIESGRILQFAHQKMDERDLQDRRDPIGRARQYMRSHLHERLSINQVARLCYLSRSHFTRRFREETGSSFAAFLIEERLSEAKRLLRETDWSVERICITIGMNSSRLRALFRERGLPAPRSFRQAPAAGSAPGRAPKSRLVKKQKRA